MTEQIEKSEQIQIQDIFSINNHNGTNECSFFGVTITNEFDNIFQDILSSQIGSSNQTLGDSVPHNRSIPKDRFLISFLFYKTY